MKNQFLFKSVLFVLLFPFLTSCSVGFLAQKDQKIKLVGDSVGVIKVNGEADTLINNQLLVNKDGNIRQIEIERPGYKTEYVVAYPYKLNWAGYTTIGMNAGLLAIPAYLWGSVAVQMGVATSVAYAGVAGIIGSYWGKMATQWNTKFRDFDPEINLESQHIKISMRDSLGKEIRLKKVAVDIKPEKSEQYNLSYKNYKAEKLPAVNTRVKAFKGIKIDDTLFSDELNTILKNNGFIDTTGMVLKSGFGQNAFLNATVLGVKSISVPATVIPKDSRITGFVKISLEIKWELLDYYGNVQLTDTILSKSGEFVSYVEEANSDYYKDALRDAMETGLYTFMQKEKFKTLSMLEKSNHEVISDTLIINSPARYVKSIEEAAMATVTIKNSKGHGSGFFISEDGYLITNYHVITDTSKLEVIMSEGDRYPAKVIRYNKDNDLALLKVDKKGVLPFSMKDMPAYGMGKEIYIIGTPSAEDLSQTLTRGIISSVRKSANGSQLIQTDASISGGNSGGPMFNKDGQLIGIANAKLVGQGIEGIAFAIPAKEIFRALVLKVK